ncbi:MAG: hypothetical protein J0I19_08220 [Alphaproteobacteria bacterium]|nr:hypothetical protein [Alphaproteobacteria bacterium]
MLLSQALGLNSSQPLLDFVDIDLDLDFPLYIDPASFLTPRDEFAQRCQQDLRDFFDAVLKSIADGDSSKTDELLAGLKEPNETHLGQSQGEPRGRGIGKIQARKILANFKTSPAAKSGLLNDLTDASLFIPGIGTDKVSDITTNIIRRHLIEYTQQQFELLGIPIDGEIPAGLLWDTGNGRWINDELARIPIISGKRVLLVPKRYVRWKGGLQQAASHYYNRFVTNFIRDEELRTNGSLVKVVKTKKTTKRVVYKKDINEKFPSSKPFLARFSTTHPDEYRKFRKVLDRHAPVAVRALVEVRDRSFNEIAFDNGLIATLAQIPSGRRNATSYHHLITGILTHIFDPDLISPALEYEIDFGRKRIDLTFLNTAEAGFFKDRKDDPYTLSREVIVECKNYTDDIGNPEIDQLCGRFDPRRGRFGLILCRAIEDPELVVRRCRDVFQAQRGLVLVLSDPDLEGLLRAPSLNREEAVQNLLRSKLRLICS